jgi:hypothetical protein
VSIRALDRYSLHLLEPMRDVPNVSSLIEQIDMAATMATFVMRSHGILLEPGCPDVPLQDEVDRYVRKLALEAYHAFNSTKEEAATEAAAAPKLNLPVPDCDIIGYAGEDRLFDVSISGIANAPRGFLRLQILFRLS